VNNYRDLLSAKDLGELQRGITVTRRCWKSKKRD